MPIVPPLCATTIGNAIGERGKKKERKKEHESGIVAFCLRDRDGGCFRGNRTRCVYSGGLPDIVSFGLRVQEVFLRKTLCIETVSNDE